MFESTTFRVKMLTAAIWYGGGFVLLWKAGELLQGAMLIRPGAVLPWVTVIGSTSIGIFKARYLFGGVCRKNLRRIESLTKPKIWQCYRKRFFIFLFFMIVGGMLLSAWSQDRYMMLLGVAALDLSIGVALLTSSVVFWKKKAD